MLLEAIDISVGYRKESQTKIFGKEYKEVLHGVSFTLQKGDCLGLVGESGSGKSTLGRVISGLQVPNGGKVTLAGAPLYEKGKLSKTAQNKVSIVFQDYLSSVNPRFRMKDVLLESLRVRQDVVSKTEREALCLQLLEQVGLDQSFLLRYPHQLSGGQLQRVCIARALAVQPQLVILDEAISSLDAATQTQMMDLLRKLQEELGLSYLFITHDLTAVTYMCNRVLFFQNGNIVETAESAVQLQNPQSEYARALLAAVIGADEGLMAASVASWQD